MDSPFLVVGAQRSGTTIVGSLLADHRDVCLTVNGKILYYLIVWVLRDPQYALGKHLRLDEIVYSLDRKWIGGISEVELSILKECLLTEFPFEKFRTSSPEKAVGEIFCAVYQRILGKRKIFGDKYNEYLLQLPDVLKVFPDCRFIYIYRNPVDVAESMVRKFSGRPWCPLTYQSAMEKWCTWNQCWLSVRAMIPPENRFEIAYENIVDDSALFFQNVCAFLRIEFYQEFGDVVKQRIRNDRVGLGDKILGSSLKTSGAIDDVYKRLGSILS